MIRSLLALLYNFIYKIYHFSQTHHDVSCLIYCLRHWGIEGRAIRSSYSHGLLLQKKDRKKTQPNKYIISSKIYNFK